MLAEWKRASKIVLVANPDYRGFTWDFAPGSGGDAAWDARLVAQMKGKTMPQIGRVEISIIEEFQTQWLAFREKQFDLLNLPSAFRTDAFDADDTLKPALADEQVSVYSFVDSGSHLRVLQLPRSGGRRLREGEDRAAPRDDHGLQRRRRHQRHPPPDGGEGGDAGAGRRRRPRSRATARSTSYDPDLANRLLDRFGYQRGADGYRRMPDGKPLVDPLREQRHASSTASTTSCG